MLYKRALRKEKEVVTFLSKLIKVDFGYKCRSSKPIERN
jgi:hypothetical protein